VVVCGVKNVVACCLLMLLVDDVDVYPLAIFVLFICRHITQHATTPQMLIFNNNNNNRAWLGCGTMPPLIPWLPAMACFEA
jgi:hypothetical protein